MTCRDFMDAAELLTPSQLLRLPVEEKPLSAHAGECRSCREWLESHRSLGNALHALSSETAAQQAGPQVEQALLQAFRRQDFAAHVVVMPQRAASSLWTLSRVFEFGAYAAVAAALIVGVFLGLRIVRDQQNKATSIQATVTAPQTSGPVSSTIGDKAEVTAPSTTGAAEEKVARGISSQNPLVAVKRSSPAAAENATSNSEIAGYVPLMLCDPLICSGDEQVIRMELPAMGGASADGSSAQTVLADVVIGEDGLVRGMRIVN
jgi:hypothetical protein